MHELKSQLTETIRATSAPICEKLHGSLRISCFVIAFCGCYELLSIPKWLIKVTGPIAILLWDGFWKPHFVLFL